MLIYPAHMPPATVPSTGYNDASCDLPLVVCLTQVIKSNQLSTDASDDVWQRFTIYALALSPCHHHHTPPAPSLPCSPFACGSGRSGASSSLARLRHIYCAIIITIYCTRRCRWQHPWTLPQCVASCKLQPNEFLFLFGMLTICLLILHLELCIC